MLTRSLHPKQKDILIINDVPVKSEISSGEIFSSVSNMGLFTALRRGTIYSDRKIEDHPGIVSTKIHPTYLDYSYFADDNQDFKKDLKKRKDLLRIPKTEDFYLREEEDLPGDKMLYHLLPHQKDGYISERLWNCLIDLIEEIKKVNPKYIIITGKWSLFLLCGLSSIAENMPKPGESKPLGCILKYRNSLLKIHPCWEITGCIVTALIHPVNAWGMQDKVPIMEIDLQKVGWRYAVIKEKGIEYFTIEDKTYILGTTLSTIKSYFTQLKSELDKKPVYVVSDIETMNDSTILDCIGFSYELDRGMCIPFCTPFSSSWFSKNEEVEILILIKEVLEHPNIRIIFHNGSYDLPVIYKLWGLSLNLSEDTMISAHILNNKLPKSLVFQSSLHCDKYTHWKDEGKLSYEDYQDRWVYNIKDCCNTLEVFLAHKDLLEGYSNPKLYALYRRRVDKLHPQLLKTMYRGVKINKEYKEALYSFYSKLLEGVPDKIDELLGFKFNPNSSQQKKKLFKEYFGMTLITKQRKGQEDSETCDAAAMKLYMEQYPLLRPFLTLLIEYTALSKFTSTFLGMKLSWDDRARTQYKITGTAFGRLSSTKNVWGEGANFQNLPEKGKIQIHYLLELVGLSNNDRESDIDELVNLTLEDNYAE